MNPYSDSQAPDSLIIPLSSSTHGALRRPVWGETRWRRAQIYKGGSRQWELRIINAWTKWCVCGRGRTRQVRLGKRGASMSRDSVWMELRYFASASIVLHLHSIVYYLEKKETVTSNGYILDCSPSPELASELRRPEHTILGTSSIFFSAGWFEDPSVHSKYETPCQAGWIVHTTLP